MAIHRHTRGIRTVATLEISKGLLAVLAVIGLLTLLHRDLGDFAEDLIFKLHLDPNSKIPWMIINKAYDVNGKELWIVVSVALGYSCIRFVEGYGLWHERVWAEYFALLSGAAYLPFEIYELTHHPDWVKWAVLIINVFIVLYMAYVRFWDPENDATFVGKSE